jgi:hypothetical protein
MSSSHSRRARLACALAALILAGPLLAQPAAAQSTGTAASQVVQYNRYGGYDGPFGANRPDADHHDGYRSDVDPRWRRTPGIVLYSRSRFSGSNIALDNDMPNLERMGFNDRTSSIRVNWGVWEVCRDANYGGRCTRVSRSVNDFGRSGLDNEISSVRLLDGRGARANGR